MFKPFNDYTVYNIACMDVTVEQLEKKFENYDTPTPVDGDAHAVTMKTLKIMEK